MYAAMRILVLPGKVQNREFTRITYKFVKNYRFSKVATEFLPRGFP